jgi:bla regulator protein blaR1
MMHAVINHLWQSTVFAILAGLLTLAFRRNRAQLRYWVWFSASVKFLVPFALLLSLGGYLGRSPAAKSLPVPAIPYAVVEVAEPFPVDAPAALPTQTHVDWVPIVLVSLWMCGFLSVTLSRVRAWLRIRAALRSSTPLEISFPTPVRSTTHLSEPGVIGFFRPRLLLPAGIRECLTPKQLQVVLAHELCHVRRRDNLTAAIHMLVEAVFWFHPLVWWVSARLMDERERACDEAILELGGEPQVYAESILKICKWCVESPLACVPGIAGADLKRRLTRILAQRSQNKPGSCRKMLLAAVSTAVIAGPVLCGFPNSRARRQEQHTAPPRPQFEVASIRPNPGCENKPRWGVFSPSPNLLEMPCVNLKSLIQTAFGTFGDGITINPQPLHMEGGPSWMNSQYYSLSAKAYRPERTQMLAGPMLQTLLENRFRLKTHREMREMPVYATAVGKRGLKVQPLAEGACTPINLRQSPAPPKPGKLPNVCGIMIIRPTGTGDMMIDVRGSTMTQFAQRLSQFAGRSVVDNTSIAGRFNFHLEFAPEHRMFGQGFPGGHGTDTGNVANSNNPLPPPETGPNLLVSLQEQIGLKLSSEKGPVSVLIIDHVEKPTAN